MFAALDLSSGQMFYRFRERKRWPQFLDSCKRLRRLPEGKLHLICDNYCPHAKAEVAAWCPAHGIEPVYTPSNTSWSKWIESMFTAIRYLTLDGSDYPCCTPNKIELMPSSAAVTAPARSRTLGRISFQRRLQRPCP